MATMIMVGLLVAACESALTATPITPDVPSPTPSPIPSVVVATPAASAAPSTSSPTPAGTPVPSPSPEGPTVSALGAGYGHTCALSDSGEVKCWGGNETGQLGNGKTKTSKTPVNVSGLASGVTAIAAGAFHTCALTTDGAATCWGSNNQGQLGDGSKKDRHAPVQVTGLTSEVIAIAAGSAHTCALMR
jgi:alpha-tubulin suppressor-like RCC1 family protein